MLVPISFQKNPSNFLGSLPLLRLVLTLHHHHSSCEVESCIKFIKQTVKKCKEANNDLNLVLLQIRLIATDTGASSLTTILFNRPVQGIMPYVNRLPTNNDCDDSNNDRLHKHQNRMTKSHDKRLSITHEP